MPKPLVTVLFIIFVVYLSLWAFVTTQPNRIAPPTHRYTILGKNFFYPSMILQGRDGAWGIIDTHTIRPVQRIYVHTYFILLGKIAKLCSLNPVAMYQIARVAGGMLFFAALYRLIILLVPPAYRLFALLFSVGVETGPLISSIAGSWTSWQPSFDNQITYERFFGLPHHITGEALGLLLLAELFLSVRRPTMARAFLIGALTLATAIILPSYIAIVGLTVMTVWFVWAGVRGDLARIFPPFFLTGSIYAAVALVMHREFSKGLPWTVSAIAEKSWWETGTLLAQYSSSLLLYAPWIILCWGIAILRWRKINAHLQWLILTMSAWVVFPFFLIPLAKTSWFPLANFRLVDATQYVPAGIVASLGLGLFVETLPGNVRRVTRMGLSILLLVSSLLLTTHYTRQTLERQKTLWSNIYPLASTWDVITTLHTYVEKGSGVLVREYVGEILPAFANVRVFIGGPHGFPDWPERQQLAILFFSGRMSDADTRSFLLRENISYVFYGPDEKAVNETGSLYPTVLVPVLSTESVVLYRVQTKPAP